MKSPVIKSIKASGPLDSSVAAALFVRLTPEERRAILDTMQRKLAQKPEGRESA